jgi:hypothetical protein
MSNKQDKTWKEESAGSVLHREIQKLLYNDMNKSDIREVIAGWLPGLSREEFDQAFTEAFVTL